jgi:hypothetical protein
VEGFEANDLRLELSRPRRSGVEEGLPAVVRVGLREGVAPKGRIFLPY